MKKFKALIKKQISNRYTLINLETKEEVDALASGKLRHVRLDEKSSFNVAYGRRSKKDLKTVQISPKVGDIVTVVINEDQALIDDIDNRKNDLTRPDVANVDQVLLVFSAIKPDFSFNLLDKFLVLIEKHDIDVVLLITKIDLISSDKLEQLKTKLNYYKDNVGIDIYYINSKEKDGFSKFTHVFKNKITVLAGQTGVGKSTLLNTLIPELQLKTQEISKSLGRGKHTTRHSELFDFNEGYICDTPGFSRLDLNIYEKEDLKLLYKDFVKLSIDCKFSSCNHINEPGCKVKEELNKGNILKDRYENYVLFYKEIESKRNVY